VFLRNRKDRLEETKLAGKNILKESHRGETGSKLSKMPSSGLTLNNF